MPYTRACGHCSAQFVSDHADQIYCSWTCGGLGRRKRTTIACAQCGKPFDVSATRVSRNVKFCSMACFDVARARRGFERQCDQCGAAFTAERNTQRNCSPACGSLSRRRRTLLHCVICATEFSVTPSQLALGTARCCSHRCSAIARGRTPLEERFWQYVDKRGEDECWLWTGGTRRGYGAISVPSDDGKRIQLTATRVSFELVNGPIPQGMQINHKCDTPACVNPRHLYAGTVKQNTRDMVERGRGKLFLPGENHHEAKLTEADVNAIRALSLSPKQIIQRYGISTGAAEAVAKGRTWKHLLTSN